MSRLLPLCFGLIAACLAAAVEPSFENQAQPPGWQITGVVSDGPGLRAATGNLTATTTVPVALPGTVIVRFRVDTNRSGLSLRLLGAAAEKPLLESRLALNGESIRGAASAQVSAFCDGDPMATQAVSTRTWSRRYQTTGTLVYGWRYPKVRNLWPERDRMDIGADFDALTPFAERIFTYRLVVRDDSRQVWLDDRLVAESRVASPEAATIVLTMTPGVTVTSVAVASLAAPPPGLEVLHLGHWFLDRDQAATRDLAVPIGDGRTLTLPVLTDAAVDLGRSLYRYRMTHGTGPDAPYVNGPVAWPSAFTVDPAVPAFRVPYRPYQRAHLVVWVDETQPTAVPSGALRFVRHQTGVPATTAFSIDGPGVERLSATTAAGHPLYRITVPVDTAAFYGFRDMESQFLEFQLTKPLALSRSYPDPIYYGDHPAGPPSSLRIVGIALEAAPFDFAVEPAQFAHVFELPAAADYRIPVRNLGSAPLQAQVSIRAANPETGEAYDAAQSLSIAPGESAAASLSLPAATPGWHSLSVRVEAAGMTRDADLSLVMLPPNTRSYGRAPNETRFGAWNLWGHYAALEAKGSGIDNGPFLALLRKLGIRRIATHGAFISPAEVQAHDLLPKGPHTTMSVYHRLNVDDPEAMTKMVADELALIAPNATDFPDSTTYHFGGEWGPSRETTHGIYPLYRGEGERALTDAELANVRRQTRIFTAVGEAIRREHPKVRLFLQWGSPMGSIPFMRQGFPKEYVDGFGMDQPMFEVLPEHLTLGSMNETLWQLRAEAARLGWPRLPINWVEGPFLPTRPGALTEAEQADHIVRYFLLGIAYGIDQFEAGVVPFEAGNYYGSEHYGAGVFHRQPLYHPKPAVAAIATTTRLLCGADLIGPVPTGSLSVYCLAFRQADGTPLYALWRVRGTSPATLSVDGAGPAELTHASGRSEALATTGGSLTVPIGPSTVWLRGAGSVSAVSLGAPTYAVPRPAHATTLAFTPDAWTWSTAADPDYDHAHIAIPRRPEPAMTASFGQAFAAAGAPAAPEAVAITLPPQPADAPMLNRYGALVPRQPITFAGQPSHLGLWVDGNSGFGRIAYRLRDAKGELWRSTGTVNDWNCDDIHGLSLICFDGWRYLRFPLPSNHPWDQARGLETTWWHHAHGDGVVDYPVTLDAIYVEARNETPYLGVMTPIPDRDIALARLTAEYPSADAMDPAYLQRYAVVRPTPVWAGPTANIIADLLRDGVGQAPPITAFEEPHHFPDGRRMLIRFAQQEGMDYRVYLSLYADGRGAELISHPARPVTDNSLVTGFVPGTPLYVFLTQVDAQKQESKPSPPYLLTTTDNFAEK